MYNSHFKCNFLTNKFIQLLIFVKLGSISLIHSIFPLSQSEEFLQMDVLQIKILVYQKSNILLFEQSTHEPFLIFCCSLFDRTRTQSFFFLPQTKSFISSLFSSHNIWVWYNDDMIICWNDTYKIVQAEEMDKWNMKW